MYLSQAIARSGFCSRRTAIDLIKKGECTVNGMVITNPAQQVELQDSITCQNHSLIKQQPIYILMNKPTGLVCTTNDELQRPTIFSLLPQHLTQGLFSVGRLDKDSTGLIMLTNDGAFAQRIAHPRYKLIKRYSVKLNKPLTSSDYARLSKGVHLYDGFIKPDSLQNKKHTVIVTLHSGKKRIVRRMFEAIGYQVKKLHRLSIGSLTIDSLKPGSWRYVKKHMVLKKLGIADVPT